MEKKLKDNVHTHSPNPSRRTYYDEVRRVLWMVLIANLTITVLKIVLGILSGTLALIADGFHSLVDSSSNLIGLAAIRLANRPPDENHPYGYQRYETMGALAIGGLLLAAAWEIGEALFERILHGAEPKVTLLIFIIVALTFPINLLITVLETRAGKQLESEILLADATHTRTDLWVTASVMVSMAGIWLGLPWLDMIIAVGVLVMIVRAAFSILKGASGWLADAATVPTDQVKAVAMDVTGVLFVHQVRSRGTPDSSFVDLHVKVHSGMSTEQAHAIATEVENRLIEMMPGVVDALVHIEPSKEEPPNLWSRIAYDLRQIADRMGLGIHNLHVHANEKGGFAIELHLEMAGDVSLSEAHDLAEQFEKQVYAQSSQPNTVITHLEPIRGDVIEAEYQIDPSLYEEIKSVIIERVGEKKLVEMQSYYNRGHINLAVRVRFPTSYTLAEAHRTVEEIEREIKTLYPDVYRVTVHTEPDDLPFEVDLEKS